MTKYLYENYKHVCLHGIEPFSSKLFDHKLLGGGVRLLEEKEDKKTKNIKINIGEDKK